MGALKGVIMALHGFVKLHHPDVVLWNPAGCPLSAFQPSASGTAPKWQLLMFQSVVLKVLRLSRTSCHAFYMLNVEPSLLIL